MVPLLRIWLAIMLAAASGQAAAKPSDASTRALVPRLMNSTGAKGISVAYVENGRVVFVGSWGIRNAKGESLDSDTVMYGASLTKAVFAYFVMQLAEEGRIELDAPIERYLAKPLPSYAGEGRKYADWTALAGDEHWRKLTPRILLTHSAGFSNFGFLEPDGKLKFHFEPGTRYAYSGDGLMLLQFVLERGMGLDVGAEIQRRVFDRFGMKNTSMIWRPEFARNLADGWTAEGEVEPHDERSRVRAAGSMDTTIADFARFAAAYIRGDGLNRASRKEMVHGQLPITTRTQFPSLQSELPPGDRIPSLSAGLGVVAFGGPQGAGFYKGGHNDSTGNTWVCIERRKRCVVILANDVRAEAAFPMIVRHFLGETGAPWSWEYGAKAWVN